MKTSPFAALTAILAALLVFGTAAPAHAHDRLKSSSPARNATVESIDEVRLEFSSKVRVPFVNVRGPGDVEHKAGEPEVDGAVVTQAVDGPLPDGRYTIAYRVVSSDGHPIEGEIPFEVKGAPTPSPSAAATESAEPSTAASPSTEASAETSTETSTEASGDVSAGSAASAAPSAPSAPDAALAAEETPADPVTFPVWLIVVIGALVGIGIGFLLSSRKKAP
ncbi:copper resistance CopC family protein [Nonomuraea maritima]|uniref:copper resistance CopC family protein n=1 Tax=Nonomuraea maritima TaxID=683260 RepID=UPI003715D6D9